MRTQAGIPPTPYGTPGGPMPLMHTCGTTGLRVSDYAASINLYNAVFGPLGLDPHDGDDPVNTAWGGVLVIRPSDSQSPETTNADVFIGAATEAQLAEVTEALARLSVSVTSGSDPGRAEWITFPDPDGNSVWVTVATPQPAAG